MPRCALPNHLKDRLHSDWPPGLKWIPRSFNAFGPRCGEGNPGYLLWPPRLVEGYDCTRWEWADLTGNNQQIYIPEFSGKVIGPEVYKVPWAYAGGMVNLNEGWWPSIIQYESEYGYLKLTPSFQCKWRTRPEWRKFYWRTGFRPDFDFFYNWGPFLGRNFE